MRILLLSQGEGFVLLGFHHLACAWCFVVDATKVENAVDDDTIQLFVIRHALLFGIGAHGIERDEEVAREAVALTIVESDDVGVVVVLEILAIDFQNFLIVAEYIGNIAHTFSVRFCHPTHPSTCLSPRDARHLYIYSIVCDHLFQNYCALKTNCPFPALREGGRA